LIEASWPDPSGSGLDCLLDVLARFDSVCCPPQVSGQRSLAKASLPFEDLVDLRGDVVGDSADVGRGS
jgi:hypothetical protein